MKTSRKAGTGLAVVIVIIACVFGPRWYTTLKVRSGVQAQLFQGMPHSTKIFDQQRELQRVSILESRWSEDRRQCQVMFQLHYEPEVKVKSGFTLTRDESGTYRGEWNDGTDRVTFAIH